MVLIVKNVRREFELPDEGAHRATIVETKDLGSVQTKFGTREMVLLVFEVEQTDSEGNPRRAFKRYSKTLHPKGALRKAIRSIIGEDPGDEYDLKQLEHRQVNIVIEHEHSGDSTFANVVAITRVKANEPPSGASGPAVRSSSGPNPTTPNNAGAEALVEDMPEAREVLSAAVAPNTAASRLAS
jgi:hypothetical protein